jgi:hypothetical protein
MEELSAGATGRPRLAFARGNRIGMPHRRLEADTRAYVIWHEADNHRRDFYDGRSGAAYGNPLDKNHPLPFLPPSLF